MGCILSTKSKGEDVFVNINKENFHDWCSKTSSSGINANEDALFNAFVDYCTKDKRGYFDVCDGAKRYFNESFGIMKFAGYDVENKRYTICFKKTGLQKLAMNGDGVKLLGEIYSPSSKPRKILSWVVKMVPVAPELPLHAQVVAEKKIAQAGLVVQESKQQVIRAYWKGAEDAANVAQQLVNPLLKDTFEEGHQAGSRDTMTKAIEAGQKASAMSFAFGVQAGQAQAQRAIADSVTSSDNKVKECVFFKAGNCRFGDKCRFKH
jgi:hypothetical protein